MLSRSQHRAGQAIKLCPDLLPEPPARSLWTFVPPAPSTITLSENSRQNRKGTKWESFFLNSGGKWAEGVNFCQVRNGRQWRRPRITDEAAVARRRMLKSLDKRTEEAFSSFTEHAVNPLVARATKDRMSEPVMDLAPRMQHRELVQILESCLKGGYVNKSLFGVVGREFLRMEVETMSQLGPNELVKLMHALGALWRIDGFSKGFFPSFPDLVAAGVSECLRRERMGFDSFSNTGLTSIVYGMGLVFRTKVGLAKTKEAVATTNTFLRKLVSEDRIATLSPQHLCMLLHGCANMGHKHTETLNAICTQIQHRVQVGGDLPLKSELSRHYEFSPSHVSSIVWALGKLQCDRREHLDALAQRILPTIEAFSAKELSNVLYGFGQAKYDNSGVLDAVVKECTREARLQSFSEASLSNMVYAIAKLGHRDEGTLDALCTAAVTQPRLERFSMQELCNVLYGFGKLEVKDKAVLGALTGEICKRWRLDSMDGHSLSIVMHCLCKLGYWEPKVFKRLSGEVVKACRMEGLAQQSVCNLICGFAIVGYNGRSVLNALSNLMLEPGYLPRFPDQNLAAVVRSLCALGYRDEGLFSALSGEIKRPERMEKFDAKCITEMVDGFGRAGHMDQDLLQGFCTKLGEFWKDGQVEVGDLPSIVGAFAALRSTNNETFQSLVTEVLKPDVLDSLKRKDVLSILRSFAHFGHKHNKHLPQILERVSAFIVDCRMHELPQIPANIARLKTRLGRDTVSHTVEHILRVLAKRALHGRAFKMLKSKQLSEWMWGMAELKYYDPALMHMLIRLFLKLDREETAADFPVVLCACARMNHRNQNLMEYGRMWASENTGDVVDVLWGMSVLGHNPRDPVFQKLLSKLDEVNLKGEWTPDKKEKLSEAQAYLEKGGVDRSKMAGTPQ